MDNKEDILTALEEFEEKSAPDDRVPEILERYLCRIATTGETGYPWDKLKSLFLHKTNLAMKDFYEKVPTDHILPSPNVENVKFEEMRSRILDMAAVFTGAPFTIQRLCELITNPHKHYKRTDKFLRGIEKNILVVSTVDPMGNKIINESKFMLNGMEPNGVESAELRTPEKIHSPFLPPPPANSPITSLFGAAASSTDSPSPLIHSWPQGGSGDAPTSISGGNEAMAASIGPNLEQPNWDAFDEYSPPEKKLRLSASSAVARKSPDITTQPTPSVADIFTLQGQALSSDSHGSQPSLSTDCEFGLSSVIDEASSTGSFEPVHTNTTHSQNVISTTSSSVVTSSEANSVTSGTPNTESSSQAAYDTAAVSSQSVESSDGSSNSDVTSGSFFKHILAHSGADNSQGVNVSGIAETTSECVPHPQIPSQTDEDGSCSRDSQGFDASPNPEDSNSPTSGPDASPPDSSPPGGLESCRSVPAPQPEVSSSSETTHPPPETTAPSESVNAFSEAQPVDSHSDTRPTDPAPQPSPSDVEMASSSEEQGVCDSEPALPMDESKEASSAVSEVSPGLNVCDQSEAENQQPVVCDASEPCEQSETVDQSKMADQPEDPQSAETETCREADIPETSSDSNVDSTGTSKNEPEVSSISQSEEDQIEKDSDSETSQQPMETD